MRFVNRIRQSKKIISVLSLFFVSFLICPFASAVEILPHILDAASWLVYWLVAGVGLLIGVIISLFLVVIEYNTFINAEPVIIGWEIIRDICNMGFVIVLLIIAIASILQIQTYHYRTWLPKLILMAILINFSKLICGILIDASQIITLTFASGIQQIGAGNFMDALGINHLLNMDISELASDHKTLTDESAKKISALNIGITILLALVVALIALVVIAAITLIFIIRIVALWILIILSPFAYLFSASPLGHQYASQWWQKFSQWVITGPVMLFFIWLSLLTIKNLTSGMFSTMADGAVPTVGLAEIGSPETMGAFILACVMLMASLIVAQQLGGYAGKIAGGAYGKITSTGDKIVGGSWKGLKGGADWLNRKQAKSKYGLFDFNLKRQWQETWKPMMEKTKRRDISDTQERGARLGEGEGIGGWAKGAVFGSKDFVRQRWSLQGIGRAARSTFGTTATQFDVKSNKEKDKIEGQEKKLRDIMSQSEFDTEAADLTKKYLKESSNAKETEFKSNTLEEAIKDLTDEIQNREKGIPTSGAYSGYSKEGLKKELDKNKEKQKENAGEKEEISKKLEDIKLKRDHIFYNRDENKGKTFFADQTEADKARKNIREDIETSRDQSIKYREKADKYRLDDFEARKARREREYEEKSKLYSEDSDELIKMHGNAIANKEHDRASVILEKLMEQTDMNEILESHGYNRDSVGLTKEELEKLKREKKFGEIEKRKGMHDFMRDYMGDKLGMSEQRMLALESRLGGIAKTTMQTPFMDAVRVEKGEYIQNNSAKQQELAAIHLNKQDAETIARRGTRFALGGEKIDGSYRVNQAGLQWVTGNWATLDKQFEVGRPNVQNTIKLSEKENMRILKKAAEQLTGDNRKGYEEMLNNLDKWGKRLRGEEIANMEERIDAATRTINS